MYKFSESALEPVGKRLVREFHTLIVPFSLEKKAKKLLKIKKIPMKYQYIKPTDSQKAVMQVFRDKFQSLHEEIEKETRYSNSQEECLKKLKEASMWLNINLTQG